MVPRSPAVFAAANSSGARSFPAVLSQNFPFVSGLSFAAALISHRAVRSASTYVLAERSGDQGAVGMPVAATVAVGSKTRTRPPVMALRYSWVRRRTSALVV